MKKKGERHNGKYKGEAALINKLSQLGRQAEYRNLKNQEPPKNMGAALLGFYGLSGLTCQTPDNASEEIRFFSNLMKNFPVLTKAAYNEIWKEKRIWKAISQLFKQADNLLFAEFKIKAAELFRNSSLYLKSMPNNHLGLWVKRETDIQQDREEFLYNRARRKFYSNRDLVLIMSGLNPSEYSEAEINALLDCCENFKEPATGRIIIENTPFPAQWTNDRLGRCDWHITRKLLEKRLSEIN